MKFLEGLPSVRDMSMEEARTQAESLLVFIQFRLIKYAEYLARPRVSDSRMHPNVIQIQDIPRVSAPNIELPMVEKHAVTSGDLLLRRDPRVLNRFRLLMVTIGSADTGTYAHRRVCDNIALRGGTAPSALVKTGYSR